MPIVEAVGTASFSPNGDKRLSKAIEAAMSQAVTDALAEGIPITDSPTLLARQMAARSAVKAAWHRTPPKDDAAE